MKKLFLIIATIPFMAASHAQIFSMSKGNIFFHSSAKLEEIEAYNRKFQSAIDATSGAVEFSLNIQDFIFDNSLMQEHFNEKYMHSEKYPTSTFVGTITNIKDIDLTKNGVHNVSVKGTLTMHGVKKEITVPGTIEVIDGNLKADASFTVALSDFGIERPSLLFDNIAETVKVQMSAYYTPAK